MKGYWDFWVLQLPGQQKLTLSEIYKAYIKPTTLKFSHWLTKLTLRL